MPAAYEQAKWPLPKSINPQDGPFRRALYTAMLNCKPLRSSCPLCVDTSLMHDLQLQPAAKPCTFPNNTRCLPTAQRATYMLEYREHLLEEHEHAVQLLEGLYRAIWTLYTKRQPEIQCPLQHLITLPALYTTPPTIQPHAESVHKLLQHMQAAVGIAEGLLWDSWSQRCCSVCGVIEDQPVIDTTAKAPPGRMTSSIVGQFGPPVDWRHHVQCHHLHQLLEAAVHVSHLCADAGQASNTSATGNTCSTVPICGQKDPNAYNCVCYAQPSALLGAVKAGAADGHRCWQHVHGRVDCCWHWGGVVKAVPPSAPPSKHKKEGGAVHMQCPFSSQYPDFVTSGQVLTHSYEKALLSTSSATSTRSQQQPCSKPGSQSKRRSELNKLCSASFSSSHGLLAHLVRFHAINLMHMVIDSPCRAPQTFEHMRHGSSGNGPGRQGMEDLTWPPVSNESTRLQRGRAQHGSDACRMQAGQHLPVATRRESREKVDDHVQGPRQGSPCQKQGLSRQKELRQSASRKSDGYSEDF